MSSRHIHPWWMELMLRCVGTQRGGRSRVIQDSGQSTRIDEAWTNPAGNNAGSSTWVDHHLHILDKRSEVWITNQILCYSCQLSANYIVTISIYAGAGTYRSGTSSRVSACHWVAWVALGTPVPTSWPAPFATTSSTASRILCHSFPSCTMRPWNYSGPSRNLFLDLRQHRTSLQQLLDVPVLPTFYSVTA